MMRAGAVKIFDFQKQVGKEVPRAKIASKRNTEDTFHYEGGNTLIGSGVLEEKPSTESVIMMK